MVAERNNRLCNRKKNLTLKTFDKEREPYLAPNRMFGFPFCLIQKTLPKHKYQSMQSIPLNFP